MAEQKHTPRRSLSDGLAIMVAAIASLALLATPACDGAVGAARSIADDTGPDGPILLALIGFAAVAAIGWVLRGRDRPWPLLALAPLVVFITWVAGAHRLEARAAHATPQLVLSARVDELVVALGLGADVWLMGGILASTVLVAASLLFALRARARADVRENDARRVLAFVVGASALAGVVYLLLTLKAFGPFYPTLRARALLGVVPSAFGVVAVFLGAGALPRGPQAEVSRDIVASAVASSCAVLLMAPACMFGTVSKVSESSIPPHLLFRVMAELHKEAPWLLAWVVPFVLPVVVAALIAVLGRSSSSSEGSRAQGAGLIVWPSALALLLLFAAWGRLGRATHEVVALPFSVAAVPLQVGSPEACNELPGSRLVHVSASRVHGLNLDVKLGADGACEAAAAAIDRLAKTDDVWMSVTPETPFARVGCLLDELARARGPRLAGTSGVVGPRGTEPAAGCSVNFVGLRTDGDPSTRGTVCKRVLLADPRCRRFEVDVEVEAESVFDVAVSASALMRWTRYGHTFASASLGAHERFIDAARLQWKTFGSHRDPADRRFDLATVRGEGSFAEVAIHMAWLDEITREFHPRYGHGPMEAPVFDMALASVDFRPSLVTDSTLPPFSVPKEPATTTHDTLKPVEAARGLCKWGGCSREVRAKILMALARHSPSSTEAPLQVNLARTLDPAAEMPVFPPPPVDQPTAGDPPKMYFIPRVFKSAPQADVVVVDRGGLDELTLERYVSEIRPELLACAMDRRQTNPSSNVVSLRVGRDGQVTWAVAQPLNSCLSAAFEQTSFPPRAGIATPQLRVTLGPPTYL